MKRTLTRIDTYSLARVLGIVGLVVGGVASILMIAREVLQARASGTSVSAGLIAFILVGTPVLYALITTLAVALYGSLINFVMRKTGGIEIELRDEGPFT